jgi:hypothetical protein
VQTGTEVVFTVFRTPRARRQTRAGLEETAGADDAKTPGQCLILYVGRTQLHLPLSSQPLQHQAQDCSGYSSRGNRGSPGRQSSVDTDPNVPSPDGSALQRPGPGQASWRREVVPRPEAIYCQAWSGPVAAQGLLPSSSHLLTDGPGPATLPLPIWTSRLVGLKGPPCELREQVLFWALWAVCQQPMDSQAPERRKMCS